jgi:hypothetical protein
MSVSKHNIGDGGKQMARKPKTESVAPARPNILVYQMKVTLKAVRPPIWRRIQVKSDMTLKTLHRVIQEVMGWEDAHLHDFNVHGVTYGTAEDGFGADEKKFRLSRLNLEVKDKFLYTYDFGDTWEHTILIEKILPVDEKAKYPTCLGGKRSCPPEDCGGPWGYMGLLDVLQDPDHPEYEDSMAWLGEDFDSELFDAELINFRLDRIRR